MLSVAGFALEHMKGVWLCRTGGVLLSLEPDPLATGTKGVVRRFALAARRPDDSFIWWAEARRVSEPDLPALRSLVGGCSLSTGRSGWRESGRWRAAPHPGTMAPRVSSCRRGAPAAW